MSTLLQAKQLSHSLHEEADQLLKVTGLHKLLEQFGKTELGGSYKYDLMIDRDLDFGVTIKELTIELRSEIVNKFTDKPWAYSVNMTDRITFSPKSNLQAPRGLYIGLTIPFPDERWNIDIWFTLENQDIDKALEKRIMSATNDQKERILELKYQALKDGNKEKGLTSIEIYKKVLNG